MTINADELQREGWYVDTVKIQEEKFPELGNTKEAIAELMNCDMKSFGASVIANRLDKKGGFLIGPLVLQLTSWRNISYPKIPEHDDNDGVCKLLLSDGFSSAPCVQLDGKLPISGRTPYGSKVLLSGKISCECGHLILNNSNCKLLGGYVQKLVERWKMSKLGLIVVKKVEKDASYTKFEPFSNAKVEALSKAVKNIDIKAERAPLNDRPPRSNAQRDAKPDNGREKASEISKSEKDGIQCSEKATEAPESSRRQRSVRNELQGGHENGENRRNRNATETQQQLSGRSQYSRPVNHRADANDKQSSSRRFYRANTGRGGQRLANRYDSQPSRNGGRNSESQRHDALR